MKAVVQRVLSASVTVDGNIAGEIGQGLAILLGVNENDTSAEADLLAKKTAGLRIFCDENDQMNLSLLDVSSSALVIPNFTLCADIRKGNRPSFINAMGPETARKLYEQFCGALKDNGVLKVENGVFGADMKINILNNGPITIILDTDIWRKSN